MTVAAKAVVIGAGGGYLSNTWWPATMSYQPTNAAALGSLNTHSSQRRHLDLQREGEAALYPLMQHTHTVDTPGNFVNAPPCPPSLTELGVVIVSSGPMWCVCFPRRVQA